MAPLPVLAAIAQATDTIRLGTLVLNNDMRNPVQLAWEAATLDRLSNGRFEIGLGAGHTPQEYTETDVVFDTPQRRKERLPESVEIIRRLVDGDRVDFSGNHYNIEGARIDPADQDHLPILVGGNGKALLTHAGAHADIVGLQGFGHRHHDPGRCESQPRAEQRPNGVGKTGLVPAGLLLRYYTPPAVDMGSSSAPAIAPCQAREDLMTVAASAATIPKQR